jgi:hypothetical protein
VATRYSRAVPHSVDNENDFFVFLFPFFPRTGRFAILIFIAIQTAPTERKHTQHMDYPTLTKGVQQLQVAMESHQTVLDSTNFCWSVCLKNTRLGTELTTNQKGCFGNCVRRSIEADVIVAKRIVKQLQRDSGEE